MELLQRLDTWVALITLATVAWFLGVIPLLDYLGLDMGEALRSMVSRRGVNPSAEDDTPPPAGYVAPRARAADVAPMSAQDTDTDTDTDITHDIHAVGQGAGQTLYRLTEEQLAKVRADEQLAGVARALGTLKGLGLLGEVERTERLTELKNSLVGTSRARHKQLNRLIADAEGKVAQHPERELLGVADDGQRRLIER